MVPKAIRSQNPEEEVPMHSIISLSHIDFNHRQRSPPSPIINLISWISKMLFVIWWSVKNACWLGKITEGNTRLSLLVGNLEAHLQNVLHKLICLKWPTSSAIYCFQIMTSVKLMVPLLEKVSCVEEAYNRLPHTMTHFSLVVFEEHLIVSIESRRFIS